MSTERGIVVWVTSARAEAAHEVAVAVAEALAARELPVELLHPERPELEGAGAPDGLAAVATMLAAHGVHGVVAEAASPRAVRERVRRRTGRMIEVHVLADAPSGSTWEAPTQAEAEVDAAAGSAAAARVLRTLELLGYLKHRDDLAYSPDEEREVIKRLKAFGYM
ncbi:MAG TPA: hypothetical protein VNO26_11910 [Candidatus Limnocylindria bacterium]|nr:hypothetical protein [Candidatus Limnocylindria bacterium]